MTEVSSNIYDNGSVGDGNLTETIAYPDGNAGTNAVGTARVTLMNYDWRDRLVASQTGPLSSTGSPVQAAGSGSYATVSLYSDGGLIGSDTLLAQSSWSDSSPPGVSVFWVGLALPYTDTEPLTLNNYTITGPLGSAPWNDGLFQELNQASLGTLDSGDGYVPGS